ncbi:hypothetical protein [Actinoplanes xinjiangensis]|uniref:Uncharacterized protein n=1 Tax=Actinoplanes xinjiangensis TaxID=512350 RepID=A0A316FS62_9ACTN|nr:hypothetical protein [Actinoplanes xinjiangensis]PWK50546.1 hypothetical protein BC793_103432 [Actinoplanes xinjiangensis]GIF36435.1 hypothetical protein Axi01nite_07460 [Actinoplanes xinjiangensis]
MTGLERRYRRLMRVYPAGHRAAYEEEMIGVLLSGAPPGRRFPAPADAMDLIRAGLTARLGRAFHLQRGTGWRDAAAVTALFAALLMAGAGINRLIAGLVLWGQGDPLRLHGVDGLMLLDPAMRTVVWPLVVLAAVLGLRRTTVALAVAGVLVQAVVVGLWSVPMNARGLSPVWGLAAGIAITALFAVAVSGRWVRSVLGARGLALAVGGAALAAVTRMPALEGFWVPQGFDQSFFQPGEVIQDWAPVLVLAAATWTAGRWVRRRIAVLSATLFTVVHVLRDVPGLVNVALRGDLGGAEMLSGITVSLLAPVVILGGGLGVLRVLESLADRGHGQVRAHE